ncbi:MAG: two-component system, chemotaxis family, protein-glutamate methylesterase/glutaminase [Fusobacteriaceae bacterium]|jgi:two-component system chemotaxis response regulator CheB|nr:two-component system, chemotaxis family, protein-glutamate methylesterase/glutaminase [Fusobacteriaceae bacterium]
MIDVNTIKLLIIEPNKNLIKIFKAYFNNINYIKLNITNDIKTGRNLIVYDTPNVLIINKNIDIDVLSFLKKVFKFKNIPTLVIGDFSNDKDLGVELVENGVLEILSFNNPMFFDNYNLKKLEKKVYALSLIKPHKKENFSQINKNTTLNIPTKFNPNKIIAIGASTGGPVALKEIIKKLPFGMPPILIAQHMPEFFTTSFASHLNTITPLNVVEAKDNMPLEKNTIYVAPGDRHLEVKKIGTELYTKLTLNEPVHFQRPSVEVLFYSVGKYCGKNAIGVILTGMGKDGAKGLLYMRNQGAYTIGQDKDSSTVYGMPKAAYEIGAVKSQVPLSQIANYLVKLTRL